MTFLTHLEETTIQRLVEGLLDDAEAAAAKQHIEDCGRCRRRTGEVSAIFTALSAPKLLPEPPADFLSLVMSRVDSEPGLVVQSIRPRTVAISVGAGAAAVAAGGAMLVSGGQAILPTAQLAEVLTTLLTKADLFATVAKASAPLVVGAGLASALVLAPFLVRAIRAVEPARARLSVHS
jgi:hypothetical protein